MKTVFITGVNGFVGQYLADELRNNYSIIGLVGSDKELPKKRQNTQFIPGDINSPTIYNILNEHKPEVIIHLAAITQTWFTDPSQVFKVNLEGTINLYESIRKVQKNQKYSPKILYVSSSEIYGKTTNPQAIKEEDPFYPSNHYAVSKLAADRLSYEYTQTSKLNIIIARPFTHTGAGQARGFFVPDMASQIAEIEMKKKNSLSVGNLESIRDYLSVKDVVRAYRLLIEADIVPGEAFNICSGKGIQVSDILQDLLNLSSKNIVVKKDPKRLRPSDVPVFVGDNTKIKKQVGWQSKESLEDTLKEVLEYWRSCKE